VGDRRGGRFSADWVALTRDVQPSSAKVGKALASTYQGARDSQKMLLEVESRKPLRRTDMTL
jgi:hypothetical protein